MTAPVRPWWWLLNPWLYALQMEHAHECAALRESGCEMNCANLRAALYHAAAQLSASGRECTVCCLRPAVAEHTHYVCEECRGYVA